MDDTRYTTTTDFSGTLHVCNECRGRAKGTPNFPRTTADVKHASTCSLYAAVTASPVTVTAAQAAAARSGGVSHSGLTEDEIAQAVRDGSLSANDALNRDY